MQSFLSLICVHLLRDLPAPQDGFSELNYLDFSHTFMSLDSLLIKKTKNKQRLLTHVSSAFKFRECVRELLLGPCEVSAAENYYYFPLLFHSLK